MSILLRLNVLILFFTLFPSKQVSAQNEDFFTLINPSFDVGLDLNSEHWGQSFGIAHRDVIYQNSGYDFKKLFLELAEYTSYNWNNQRLGLKVKYRFKDLYTGKHNELRLAQDYSLVIPITETLGFGQKFSVEERIRDRFSLRPRYRAVVENSFQKPQILA
jgi:hypothetical protein